MKIQNLRGRRIKENIPSELEEPIAQLLEDMNGKSAGSPKFHEEIDLLEHVLMVYDEMKERNNEPIALAIALTHDTGKLRTQEQENDAGHDLKGIDEIEERFNHRVEELKAGSKYHHKVKNVAGWAGNQPMKEKKVIELAEELENLKVSIDILIDLAEADAKGRIPKKEFPRETVKERLDLALKSKKEIGKAESLKKRNKEVSEYSAEAVNNMVVQDRVEFLKERQPV